MIMPVTKVTGREGDSQKKRARGRELFSFANIGFKLEKTFLLLSPSCCAPRRPVDGRMEKERETRARNEMRIRAQGEERKKIGMGEGNEPMVQS